MCREWESYEAFASFANSNGYVEGLTIDRIDAQGDYCPGNVQFISFLENVRRREKGPVWTANARKSQKLCAESRRTPTRCVETGEVFRSRVAAAKAVGRTGSNILQAINLGCRCGGFHWENFSKLDKHEAPVVKCTTLPDVRAAENNEPPRDGKGE